MRAEILSIGDELTSGQRLDTNSQWLSQELANLGVKTVFHTTVGDSMEDNIDAFRTAVRRSDLVIATGGLGPTADDLTREAMALAFDSPLEMRQEALDHITSLFAKRKRPMPERNVVQAMFPSGSRMIDNPHGSAPGIDMTIANSEHPERTPCRIFSLPGVPAEMKQMYAATVQRRLVEECGLGTQRWYFHTLKVFGIGESDVEKRLPDLIHRDRDPIVGITVSQATITLRIAALCRGEKEFLEKIEPTNRQIRDELGPLVFGEGEIDLEHATHALLNERNAKLGVIEVGSGAWIQHGLAKLAVGGGSGLACANWYPSLDPIVAQGMRWNQENTIRPDEASAQVKILAPIAESFLAERQLDLCLAAGTYPTRSSIESMETMPTCDFTFVLARKDRKTKHTTLSLGAAPDVLYHRLAKTGWNFLRLDLLQND